MTAEQVPGPNAVEQYFADVFPDMALCLELPADTPELIRGRAAGIGVAEVFLDGGESFQAPYITETTAYTEALRNIYEWEKLGILPIGSHDQAVDSIFNGEFDDQWGAYII